MPRIPCALCGRNFPYSRAVVVGRDASDIDWMVGFAHPLGECKDDDAAERASHTSVVGYSRLDAA